MKEIKLTQGQVTQVDDADYEWLNQYKWYALWKKNGKHYYAVRTEYLGTVNGKEKNRTVRMHRQILGLEHGDPRIGDHKTPSETLNNQRSNLRIANTGFESVANQGLSVTNTTGFKGVCLLPSGRYRADIQKDGKKKCLGTRDTKEEASELYWAAAQEQYGEFARIA